MPHERGARLIQPDWQLYQSIQKEGNGSLIGGGKRNNLMAVLLMDFSQTQQTALGDSQGMQVREQSSNSKLLIHLTGRKAKGSIPLDVTPCSSSSSAGDCLIEPEIEGLADQQNGLAAVAAI
uniref:Uncharacterized protein n=1 Tax=Ditylenchus dipsaci TaxID=166011 RepID=A0A915DA45_9BILA